MTDVQLQATGTSPPIGSLGRELARSQRVPGMISLGLAAIVGLAPPFVLLQLVEQSVAVDGGAVLWIWIAAAVTVGSLIAACALVAFLPPLLLRDADRSAAVVHAWLGAREIRRLYGSTSGAFKIPTTPEAAAVWLAATPDTAQLQPLRFELLLFTRQFDQARALVVRYPRLTAFDEFRIVEAEALIEDQATGHADEAAVRAAAARVPAGDERAEAMACVGVMSARRLIGRGDWRKPLAAARPYIKESDATIILRDFGAPVFRKIAPLVVLPITALVVIIAVVITFSV